MITHSPATKEYIAVAMHNPYGNQPKHVVKVTPMHTFPTCGGETKKAHALRAGDCLHTADGDRHIEHAKAVPATGETYSIELKGHGIIVADGVITHARDADRVGDKWF